jgi:hypothetical protein
MGQPAERFVEGVRAVRLADLRRCAFRDDAALVDDEHAGADAFDDFENVRGHENRLSLCAAIWLRRPFIWNRVLPKSNRASNSARPERDVAASR